jgi:AraC-like DNA-binding protein
MARAKWNEGRLMETRTGRAAADAARISQALQANAHSTRCGLRHPSALDDGRPHTEHKVFANSVVTVGYVRCTANHPSFATRGHVFGYRFVFPRRNVWIHATGSRPFVSDPSIVEFYNDGDQFTRAVIDPLGDQTEWYQVGEADFRDLIRRYDPAAADSRRPLRFTHGPTDSRAYALQRTLFRGIATGRVIVPLEIEETVFAVLDSVLARAYESRRSPRDTHITRDERDIADRATAVLNGMTSTRASLATIARNTGVSVFHLSRIFRKVTGRTLANHHLHLRLFASLALLGESDMRIEEIATHYGFVGHSHYTSVFRRVFGLPPSTYRTLPTAPRRRATASVQGRRLHSSDKREGRRVGSL